MKRRLDLATALVHEPEVLFLDEPTTGLDPLESRRRVGGGSPAQPASVGMTIFLTTQYLEEADELADRVGIIAKGRIVAEGTPASLKRSIGSDVIIVKGQPGDAERIAGTLASVEGLGRGRSSGRRGRDLGDQRRQGDQPGRRRAVRSRHRRSKV